MRYFLTLAIEFLCFILLARSGSPAAERPHRELSQDEMQNEVNQGEALTKLWAIYGGEKAFHAEHGTYATDLIFVTPIEAIAEPPVPTKEIRLTRQNVLCGFSETFMRTPDLGENAENFDPHRRHTGVRDLREYWSLSLPPNVSSDDLPSDAVASQDKFKVACVARLKPGAPLAIMTIDQDKHIEKSGWKEALK